MKKLLLACLMAAFAIHAYSRERITVDLEAVKKAVQDTAYYNNLERQFFNFKKLSPQDLVNLYYGQAFQEDYSPYDKIMWPFGEMVKEGKMREALAACISMLEERPAYLPLLSYTIDLAETAKIDEDILMALITNKVKLLLLIFDSGRGDSLQSPLIVTSVSDEYHLMNSLKLEIKKQSLIEEGGKFYDIQEVVPNELYKADKIYFDINLPFPELEKMFQEDKKGND